MVNNSIREETQMKCNCGKGGKCSCGGMAGKKKGYAAGGVKMPSADDKGLKKLPTAVRNKMGYMSKGGMARAYMKGGYCAGPAKGHKK